MSKKLWQKPVLAILIRTKADEAVLTSCKGGAGLVSPAENFNGCALAGCDSRCDSYVTS